MIQIAMRYAVTDIHSTEHFIMNWKECNNGSYVHKFNMVNLNVAVCACVAVMKSKLAMEGMVHNTFIFFLSVVKNTASALFYEDKYITINECRGTVSHITIPSTDLILFVAGARNHNAITITHFTSNIKC